MSLHTNDTCAILTINNQFAFNFILFLELYLLIGVTSAAAIQFAIEFTDQEVTPWEAMAMVLAWPIIIFVFIWYFIKGLTNRS